MSASSFLELETLAILALGLLAFALDTAAGLVFGKMMCAATGGKFNPLLGAAGISAFPMAGRLVAQIAREADADNYLIMHAMGVNTGGQLGSVIAGGVLLSLVSSMM